MIRLRGRSGQDGAAPPRAQTTASSAPRTEIVTTRHHSELLPLRSKPKNSITFTHKNHKNISTLHHNEIKSIDHEISQIVASGADPSAISEKLLELFSKSFFESKIALADKQAKILDDLNACPIYSPDNEAEKANADHLIELHTQKFIESYNQLAENNKLSNRITPADEIAEKIKQYLMSNRADRANFESIIFSKEFTSNGSAQKMALETFESAFPFIKSDHRSYMRCLYKLIDILPHLDHHATSQRSPQIRGLKVLGNALDGLPTNDLAQLSTRLMNLISNLSDDISKHRYASMPIEMCGHPLNTAATTFVGGLGLWVGGLGAAVAGAGALALGLLSGAGAAVGAALLVPAVNARARALEKQQQGAGLFLLKDQLAKIRTSWDQVSPKNKHQLTEAYNKLKNNITSVASTKDKTLKIFFNDSFINPSEFGKQPNPGAEAREKFHHHFIKPISTRLTPVTKSKPIDGYQDASISYQSLADLLHSYHLEANKLGLKTREFPSHILTNLIKNTERPEFGNAANELNRFFLRLKEIAEYSNPISRGRILSTILDMTHRLAQGDEKFIHEFVAVSRGANENCHNNARQYLKILTSAVVSDKAMKGEDGLDNYESLVKLGRQFFHEKTLHDVTRDFITHANLPNYNSDLEVEIGNAVEIALGNKFQLPHPIKGMNFSALVLDRVTPPVLKNIEEEIARRIKPDSSPSSQAPNAEVAYQENSALIDFLVDWTPLTQRILEDRGVKARLSETITNIRAKFNDDFDAYSLIPNPSDEQTQAIEASGAVCKAAEAGAQQTLLRQVITLLLNDQNKQKQQAGSSAI